MSIHLFCELWISPLWDHQMKVSLWLPSHGRPPEIQTSLSGSKKLSFWFVLSRLLQEIWIWKSSFNYNWRLEDEFMALQSIILSYRLKVKLCKICCVLKLNLKEMFQIRQQEIPLSVNHNKKHTHFRHVHIYDLSPSADLLVWEQVTVCPLVPAVPSLSRVSCHIWVLTNLVPGLRSVWRYSV